MLEKIKVPHLYSYSVVTVAMLFTVSFLGVNSAIPLQFNLLLLILAEMCVVFGAVEMGLAYSDKYKTNEEVFMAMSRAVSSFGLAMFCMLLIAAHEIIKC